MIAALLAGLLVFAGGRAAEGALVLTAPSVGPVAAMALGLGLIVTVEGFETSRYLGAS